MKYLVVLLLVLAVGGALAYFGLTYYKSTPKVSTNVTDETSSTPSSKITQINVDETEPSDDITALDRDLTETDSLDLELDNELKKI